MFSKKEGRFEWAGVSRITKEDLAGPAHGPHSQAWLEAYFWLEQRLEGGLSWPASDIETEAEGQDLSAHVLKRAKKALGVVSSQKRCERWRLDVATSTTPPLYSTYFIYFVYFVYFVYFNFFREFKDL